MCTPWFSVVGDENLCDGGGFGDAIFVVDDCCDFFFSHWVLHLSAEFFKQTLQTSVTPNINT